MVGGRSKAAGGGGVGFLFAALVFVFVADEADSEELANLPAVVSFTVMVVGKAGLVCGCVAIGFGLLAWEVWGKSAVARSRAGAETPAPAFTPRDTAAAPPFAGSVPEPEVGTTPPPKGLLKLRGRVGGTTGLRKGVMTAVVDDEPAGTAVAEPPRPVSDYRPTGGAARGIELTTARYLNRDSHGSGAPRRPV